MATEASGIIELELSELMCVESSLAPSETSSSGTGDGSTVPTRETCLKVGAALLEALQEPARPAGISFNEDELWLLRERLSIYTSLGPRTDVGLAVKSKVYAALLSIANERSARDAFDGMFTVQHGAGAGLSRQEVDDAIRKWADATGEYGNPDTRGAGAGSNGTGDDAEDDPDTQTPVKS